MSVVFAPQTLLILVQNFSDFRVWFSMGSLKKLSKRKCYRWKKKKKKKKRERRQVSWQDHLLS